MLKRRQGVDVAMAVEEDTHLPRHFREVGEAHTENLRAPALHAGGQGALQGRLQGFEPALAGQFLQGLLPDTLREVGHREAGRALNEILDVTAVRNGVNHAEADVDAKADKFFVLRNHGLYGQVNHIVTSVVNFDLVPQPNLEAETREQLFWVLAELPSDATLIASDDYEGKERH